MRLLAMLILGAGLTGLVADEPAAPEFNFVMSPRTQKHIAIQPQSDHFRIYFPIRVRNWPEHLAFAQVRTAIKNAAGKIIQVTVSSIVFEVKTDNDIWSIYLRAPKYSNHTATYQVEIGPYLPDELDTYQVSQAFAWEIRYQQQGQMQLIHNCTSLTG